MGRSTFELAVDDVVRAIPPGRVASYGAVAELAAFPGRARQVGRALRGAPGDVPWWRVLSARGRISIPAHGHADRLQRALLRDEGVRVDEDGRVERASFWSGE